MQNEPDVVEISPEATPLVHQQQQQDGTFKIECTIRVIIDQHVPCSLWALVTSFFYLSVLLTDSLVFNRLPYPKTIRESMPADFTEERARIYLDGLVSVGARPAGSYENDVFAVEYLLSTFNEIQASSPRNNTMEVDIQRPSGSFFMPFLDDFTSVYSNITNTVVRVTSAESDENALLLNCHTDSVINSPGASDDAVACAVLLEILRSVMQDGTPLLHPLILLFNGAEENILQASHGFITQHKWAKQVKAFINLEAAGAGGKEYIFQTGPENPWLIWTWAKHAPYPAGSSLAQDVFQSGLIPADTDFRIFRDFGNVPGIDLAYIHNGYVYHTMHDTPAMINPGSIQRAGENILAVARHLTQSPESLIANPADYRHGHTAYCDLFGLTLVIVPLRILSIINYMVLAMVCAYFAWRMTYPANTGYGTCKNYLSHLWKATLTCWLSLVFSILSMSAVAFILTVTGKSLPWYTNPPLSFFLYVPAGMMGLLFILRLPKRKYFRRDDGDVVKINAIFVDGMMSVWVFLIVLTRNIGMSYLFVFPTWFAVVGEYGRTRLKEYDTKWLWGVKFFLYMGWIIPVFVNMYQMMQVGPVLSGLAARAGSDVPPEAFMVVLYALIIFLCYGYDVMEAQTITSMKWFHIASAAALGMSLAISFSSYGFPYNADPTGPASKRFFMQHIHRQFFDAKNALQHEDSGMFICHMDYFQKEIHLGPEVVMESDYQTCNGTYCEMPFLLPIQKIVRRTQYVPTPPPPTSVTVDLYPLDIKWEGEAARVGVAGQEVKISFTVTGPPDMALHIAPLRPGSLIGWSFESDIKEAHSKYAGKESYFILHGGGIQHPVWKFWLEFSLPELAKNEPILELALNAHYKPSGPVSKVNVQTPELEDITSQLNEWVAPMTWVSLYRNYEI